MDSIKEENIEPENNQNIPENSEDFSVEPDAENTSRNSLRKDDDVISELKKKLKESDEEKKEYLLGWQRTKADYINSKKQDEAENKLMVKYAEAGLLTDLVPVLDSFDLAFENKEAFNKLPEEWKKGIQQIQSQLQSILKDHDLEIIDPISKPFDPREAEAVGMMDTNNSDEEDKVLSVFQKGYKLQGKVLRPAKVRVGKYTTT